MTLTLSAVLLAAVLSGSSAAPAAAPSPGPVDAARPGHASPEEAAEAFLASIQAGDYDAAFSRLFVGSALLQDLSTMNMIRSQAKAQLPLFGDGLGVERVGRREVGTSIVILRYVARQESEGITWAFAFYKARDKWTVSSLRWYPTLEYLK